MAKPEPAAYDQENPVVSLTDDEGTDGDGEDDEGPFEYDEEAINMVAEWRQHSQGQAALKRIGSQIARWFDDCDEGSREFRERMTQDWRMYSGDLAPKEPPYEDLANPHVPMSLENITRLVFMMSSEVYGDWTNVFGVVPIGPDDRDMASNMSRHGNWQIRNQIPDFRRQFGHRAPLMYFQNGDVTAHSYYDFVNERNAHDVLTPDEFFTPYTHTSTMPDYSDCPYYFKVIPMYRYELQRYRDKWFGIEEILDKHTPSWDDEPVSTLREAVAEIQGVRPPESGDKFQAPYKMIWFEGWLDLPNQDQDRFCKIIFEYASKKIVHLSIHEDDDWQDRIRYENQIKEMGEYRMAEQRWGDIQQQQMEENAMVDAIEDGAVDDATPEEQEVVKAELGVMQSHPLPAGPPPPPAWMADPEDRNEMPLPPKRVPIRMFAHGVCLEPMVGSLGLGPGRILGDMNRNANIALGQYSDGAALHNNWSIITAGTISFEEELEIRPGKVNKAEGVMPADLHNGIYELKPAPASEQLLQIVKLQWDWAQSSTMAQEVMSGAPGKSGETFRGHAQRLAAATRHMGVHSRKFTGEFLAQVLRANAYLNSKFMREEEAHWILDDKMGDPAQPVVVGRRMYERNYQVEFTADMKFTSDQEKITAADEVVQMPLVYQDTAMPGAMTAFKQAALREALKARGLDHMIPLLGPEEPPPPTPLGLPPPAPPPGMGPPPEGEEPPLE